MTEETDRTGTPKPRMRALSGEEQWPEDIPPRDYRSERPVELDREPVRVRGDALHPILWRGRQWAVTTYGLELLDGTYVIEAKRLVEDIERSGWPAHMSGKAWCDPEEFATAWLVALALHGVRVEGGPRVIREALGRQWLSSRGKGGGDAS